MTVQWLEMPMRRPDDPEQAIGPKYAIPGNAVVLYRNDRAYACLTDADTIESLLTNPDVHIVSTARRARLQESFSVDLSAVERLANHPTHSGTPAWARAADRIGLGDVVTAVTHALGIKECGGCRRRRRVLNRLTLPRRWRSSSAPGL